MYPGRNLSVSSNYPIANGHLAFFSGFCRSNIVHTLEYEDIFNTRVSEYVAVEAAENVGTKSVCENAVAARCLIEDGNGSSSRVGLEAGKQKIGPAADKRS